MSLDPATVMYLGRESLFVLLKVALPLMLVALIVGLAISLIQALTQIQEMTLSFVPKIIAMLFSLVVLMPYIGNEMSGLMEMLSQYMIAAPQ